MHCIPEHGGTKGTIDAEVYNKQKKNQKSPMLK